MSGSNEDEIYTSPEQDELMRLMDSLSKGFIDLVRKERTAAIDFLRDSKSSTQVKQSALYNYFSFRMRPQDYSVQLSDGEIYKLDRLKETAKTLNNDRYFYWGDADCVVDNLDPFFSLKGLSINIEDVVLAYHYYRFSKDDESLSNLVKIIGYYSKNALELDDFDPTITDYSVDATLTFEQSIALMKKFLAFVDKSLLDYATQRKLYSERFHFSDTDKAILGFSARMDRDATYSFSKISARGFRIESLKRYLMSFHNPDPWYEFHLDVLLNKLYDVYYQTVEDDKIISSPGPTISSLAEIAEQECQQWEKNSEHYRIYDDIGKFISGSIGSDVEKYFNANSGITEDDIEEANHHNNKVDREFTFEIIKNNLPFIYIVIMAINRIPELSSDKEKMNWRRAQCRQLCEIYEEKYAYDIIQDKYDDKALIEEEAQLAINRANLFETFLTEFTSKPIEELLKTRLELLDKAKAISPRDVSFIEQCSSKILELLKEACKSDIPKIANDISNSLKTGNNSSIFSNEVINTLATAELLFSKYANECYEKQGFDYSSISALYYQAFENAYNDLIWKKYAKYLNKELVINGRKYTRLLYGRHTISSNDDIYGYLPIEREDRNYYCRKPQNNRVEVNETCMYKSFAIFINRSMTELPCFYDWFAKLIGFADHTELANNSEFMNEFNAFRRDLDNAVGYRNLASHGGAEIKKNECTRDRKIVISDLQMIRAANYGLMQHLVSIWEFCNSSDI